MKVSTRVLALVPLLLAGCAAPEARSMEAGGAGGEARKLLTLEQTSNLGDRVDFSGELPRWSWAEDGVHLVHEDGERTVWVDPATWTESDPPAEAAKDDSLARALVAACVDEERAKRVPTRGKQTGANGGVLVELDGDLWFVHDGGARQLVAAGTEEVELPELSPDGSRVAFVQGNDLVLVDTASGARRDVTTDGSTDVFNAKLDWVYQEELYGRGDFKAFWWSPDSRHVAFLRLDESAVHDFTVIDHVEDDHYRVEPEVTRYPKVGDPNPTVALAVATVDADVAPRSMDLSDYAAEEPLVVRVDWTPSGMLHAVVQDRIQTWAELVEFDPWLGMPRTLLRESSGNGWVERPERALWLADGTFLWQSDRTGQRHVYRYRADGTLVGAVTSGDWSVKDVEHVDDERGLVWFTGTKDGVVDHNLYRIALDGTGLVRLTPEPGRHAPRWNAARTLFLDRHSSLERLPSLVLRDGGGALVRELGTADAPDLERYLTSSWELHEIRARDGFPLDVAVLPPVPFDPARRYPIWLPTYSGPDAPSVSNSWNASAWYQFLAQNGVMVLQVNVRTASGRGHAVTERAYRQLGVQELLDLEDAVDWACREKGGDPARVGITGSSYGGFMAAYALTRSDRFAAAIAASGVHDWRMYDTIYTERFMSTPARNPEGYEKSSVVAGAKDLRGHLVITHGEMDDNVHLQNAIHLVYALQKAGKDFELVIYPQSRHGIGDRDLRWWDRKLTWRVIQERLLGEPEA